MCETVRLPGGGTAIVCGGHRRRPACRHCGYASTKFCDHRHSDGKTCDAPICGDCALHVPGKNVDYCQHHRAAHLADVPGALPFAEPV